MEATELIATILNSLLLKESVNTNRIWQQFFYEDITGKLYKYE